MSEEQPRLRKCRPISRTRSESADEAPRRHAPRRRRPHPAQPEDGGLDVRLHGGGHARARATGSPSTTTRTPRSSSTACAARSRPSSTASRTRCRRARRSTIPFNMRHRLRNEGDEEAFIVFHLGPAGAASRHSDTSTPSSLEAHASSQGSACVAPGGVTRDSFWDRITAGKTATRQITFFDPSGLPVPDRRRGRLRPARGRPERARDPAAWTATSSSPPPPAMEAIEDSGARPRGRRPRAHGRHAGLGRGRDDGARGRLRGGLQPRPGVARRPRLRAAVPLPGARAQQPGQRDRAQVRRAGARRP